jgi:hypothetical protein
MNYNFISSNATSTTSASSSNSSSSPKQKEEETKQADIAATTLLLNQNCSSKLKKNRKQNFDSYRDIGTPVQIPDMSTMNNNQPTAYHLLKTVDGNTLLIPHSTSVSNGIFLQNNQSTINRNISVPIEMILQKPSQQQNTISTNNLERPESNVYQTIENDR